MFPTVEMLAEQPFLAGLTEHQLGLLVPAAGRSMFHAGNRVFHQGAPADQFWLITDGRVDLDCQTPGQAPVVLDTLRPGSVLGWSWLYPPYRWQFGAVTRDPVTAVAFDAVAVRHRCDADPQLGYALLRLFTPVIVDRLQNARLRLLDLWGAPVREVAP